MSVHLPEKIENCPIVEAVFEIRYSSKYPEDAIFGVLYAAVKDFFTEKPQALPILQLPEAVRVQDPNLKYQPYHKLVKNDFIFNIGPKVLAFVNKTPYAGWSRWSDFFYTILEKVQSTQVIDFAERIGLRYINFFNFNIFDKVKLRIELINRKIQKEPTNLRTEILDEGFTKILQIANSVNIIINDQKMTGSLIDIDCLYYFSKENNFFNEYCTIVENAHNKEKELFFSLLKESFLNKLNPIYGGS